MIWNAGDVVRLKSGGPPMTVEAANVSSAYCSWFDAQGRRQQGPFKPAMLERAADRKPNMPIPD